MSSPTSSSSQSRSAATSSAHVFYAEHTDPEVAQALRATHWYELAEWTSAAPGAALG